MVVYTAQDEENNTADKENDFTQAGPQRIIVPGPQADTAKELKSMKDILSSPGLQVERIKDDTFMEKHTTLQFRRQLDNNIDGQETSLVCHFADSQQQIVDEISLL
ncbi:hypothetical protein F511_09658 [Dorcoceras hygrometricum]|uniref:Uncharacterized protein n=1 Tax=Dorcoceras hygrometricum TaxID=472368 RepID=A0A2Z7ABU3_9LAMI|nr:hypothetical protein F511_09658 [Dorcoceras hygrometricum]